MSIKTILAFSAFAALQATAQSSNATVELALVGQEWKNSYFEEAPDNSTLAFDVDFEGQGLLTVDYAGTTIELGQDYSNDAVAALPNITYLPVTATPNATDLYTLILADASAVGGADPEGDYRHYLANSVSLSAVEGGNSTYAVDTSAATVITYYAGPGPLTGSGKHRYAWLLFQQPSNFSAPDGLATAGVSPSHFSVHDYVESSQLGDLIATTFFTVTADGTATFSAGATSAANTASAISAASANPLNSASPSGGSEKAADSSDASALRTGVFGLVVAAFGILAMA